MYDEAGNMDLNLERSDYKQVRRKVKRFKLLFEVDAAVSSEVGSH